MRRLINSHRMTRAGLNSIAHVFDKRKHTTPERRFILPRDVSRRLQRDPQTWKNFNRFPASYKRIRIGWIVAARHRREAFNQRLDYFVKMTKQNKRFGMVQ